MQNQSHASIAVKKRILLAFSAVLVCPFVWLFLSGVTSWRGKPLDPKEFWKGKTIWLDTTALLAAQKHGRFYPPIPFGEKKFSSYPEKDITGSSGGSEAGGTLYYWNDREAAFWSDFERTQPRPPEELERKQAEVKRAIQDSQSWVGISQNDLKAFQGSVRSKPIGENYPPEAFTDEALYWSYIASQNRQYQSLVQRNEKLAAKDLADRSGVDLTLLTNALNADQIKMANSWKIAYLKRLKNQNVDQSYINAYLKAWNIQPGELVAFGN
jgi:hypothetical protein